MVVGCGATNYSPSATNNYWPSATNYWPWATKSLTFELLYERDVYEQLLKDLII